MSTTPDDPGDGMREFPEAMYARVQAGVLSRVRRRRRIRDVLLGALGGGVAVALLTGATIIVLAPFQERARQVSCYPAADLSTIPAEGQRSSRDTVTDAEGYAIEFCRAMWEAGIVDPARTDAPPLELCLERDGTIAVLPREADSPAGNTDFCAALGLFPDPRDPADH